MMENLPETTPVITEQKPKRRRRWLWLLPLLLILGLLGGAFAVRQIETSHWEAGQAAIAASEWETAVTEFSAVIYQWPPFLRQHTAEATALRGLAYFQQGKQLAALTDFDDALALDPNQIDIIAYRALIHFNAEDWDLALADTETVLVQPELVPDHVRAQLHAELAFLSDDLLAADERETAVANALELANYLPAETVAELYTRQAEYSFAAAESTETLTAINQVLTLEAELTRDQQARLLPQKAHLLAAAGRWPDALATITEALRLRHFFDEPTQAALFDLRAQIYFAQGDWRKAVTEAEEALALDNELAWSHAVLAWQAYRTADFDTAQSEAEAALALDDSVGLAYTVQGALLTWRGDVYGALETLEMALSYNPDDVEALALQMFNLAEMSAFAELLAVAETAVSAQPDAPATKWAEAMAAAVNFDYPLAFALMNQAIALDNGRPEFYFYRSFYYPQQGDDEKILADLEKSLELNPEFAPAILHQAYTHADQYEFTNMEAIQLDFLEKYPDWYAVHMFSGFYYEEVVRDNDQAFAAYDKAIELLPERARSYMIRGFLYESIYEFEKATADFEAALERDAEMGGAYAGLAQIAEENNDHDQQLAYIMQAVEVTKNSRPARLDLAYYYLFNAEENEKAWEIANQLVAEDETDADARLIMAMTHAIEGNNRQALIELDQVLDLDPTKIVAYFVKSEALLNSGRYVEAARTVEQVWEYDPDAYEVHQQLFFIALNDEDLPEAERQYLLWLGNKPDYETDYAVQANMELNLGKFEAAADSFTAAIAEDAENEGLYFGRALAYISLDDSESYKADFEQILALGSIIDFISDAEYWLAVDNGLLVAVDGLATFTDEVAGFQLSYPSEWERPLLGPDDEYLFIAYSETKDGVQSINIFTIDGVGNLTITDIQAIITENVRQSADVEMLDSEISEVDERPAFVYNYELTIQDGLGNENKLLGRQYIVLVGSTAWFITVESGANFFADSLPIYEEIINSLQFLQ